MPVQVTRWGGAGLARGVDLPRLRALLEQSLGALQVDPGRLVILTLTRDDHIRGYNQRFRGIDEATDVLAFSAQEPARDRRFKPPPGAEALLGDIVISLERARVQARAAGHSLEQEVRVLAVHGLLHLLGFDHEAAADARRMNVRAKALLAGAS
jgi:probable rRNA maturation factor